MNFERYDIENFLSSMEPIDGNGWYRGVCPCCHPEERNLRVFFDNARFLVGCEEGCRSSDIIFYYRIEHLVSNRSSAPIYKYEHYSSFITHVISKVYSNCPSIVPSIQRINNELIDELVKEMNHVISRCS